MWHNYWTYKTNLYWPTHAENEGLNYAQFIREEEYLQHDLDRLDSLLNYKLQGAVLDLK
jgi:hypothetical protein